MSRLTTRTSIMGRKHDIERGQAHHWKKLLKGYDYRLIENAIDKLGELEDIEDKLGIDLVTLFKALKNGIWSSHYAYLGEEVHFVEVHLSKNKTEWYISGGFGEGHSFEDYGKTWALTKEELEK